MTPELKEFVLGLLHRRQIPVLLLKVHVAEAHGGNHRRRRADVDDPRSPLGTALTGLDKLGKDKVGKEPVPDMVRSHLQLDPVLVDSPLGDPAYARAVNEEVKFGDVGPGEEFFGGGADDLLASEVDLERAVVHVGILLLESIDAFLQLGGVAPGDDEVSWGLGCLYGVVSGVSTVYRIIRERW